MKPDNELMGVLKVFFESEKMQFWKLSSRQDFLPCLYTDDSYRMFEVIYKNHLYVAKVEFKEGKITKIDATVGTYKLGL